KLTESCPCLEFNELDFESESNESELAFFDKEKSEFNNSELLCLSMINDSLSWLEKFPDSVKLTTYLAYKHTEIIEPQRKIKSELLDWDSNIPKSLVSICIEKLAENWMGYPKLEQLIAKDRELFLQILDTDVPLQILVDNIKSDIFWKRCYNSKFSDSPLLADDKKWINAFMERHFADILENTNPRQYDPEKLRSIGVQYRPDQFQFTNNDAKNLARGMEKCTQLKILRITRTDMNCQRVKYILRGLSENLKLEVLDFSHCKIGDDGASSIGKFIMRRDALRTLILADNVHLVLKVSRMPLITQAVGSEPLTYDLILDWGCGITPSPLMKSPAGVWSTTSAEKPPTCGELLARAIGLVKTPLRSLDISVNDIGQPSDGTLSNAICLSYIVDLNLKRSGMGSMAKAVAESAAAAQRLRREAEKGIRFRRSAGKLVQASRVAKGMNIDTDPLLLAQQLSARPSIVSIASEEGMHSIQTQPLPSDFGFIPTFKSPLPSSRCSSITGPPTSRRSSHHAILEPVKEVRRTALVRRGSDGSLLQPRSANAERHIKIFIS
ncbi:hypothetical protein HW555_012260, partial [Spodoptera exigua]